MSGYVSWLTIVRWNLAYCAGASIYFLLTGEMDWFWISIGLVCLFLWMERYERRLRDKRETAGDGL